MMLDDLLKCTRPLLFATGEEEYEYACGGTCFIVRYKDMHFVVTAKHCLTNSGFAPGAVRILAYPDDPEFLPLSEYSAFRSLPGQDQAPETDVAAFQIPKECAQQYDQERLRAYSFPDLDKCPIIGATRLICRGYPSELSAVNYDAKEISSQAFVVEAIRTNNNSLPECEQLQFIDRSAIKSPNGMSGSPVFEVLQDEGLTKAVRLAGLLLRGGDESEFGHYLTTKHILTLLANW